MYLRAKRGFACSTLASARGCAVNILRDDSSFKLPYRSTERTIVLFICSDIKFLFDFRVFLWNSWLHCVFLYFKYARDLKISYLYI